MRSFSRMLVALIGLIACAACSNSSTSIQQITSIPPEALTALPTASPLPNTDVVEAATSAPVETLAGMAALAAASRQTLTVDAPTPLPLNTQLPPGDARVIAAATDTAMQPTARSIVVPITFDEFYDGYNLRAGLIMSDKLVSLDGRAVTMEGYMAPPLKAELDYFVLTRIRLSFCPFCTTGADWPDDIALVYLTGDATGATEHPIRVTGRLEVGTSVDQETGMVSLVRIYADQMELLS